MSGVFGLLIHINLKPFVSLYRSPILIDHSETKWTHTPVPLRCYMDIDFIRSIHIDLCNMISETNRYWQFFKIVYTVDNFVFPIPFFFSAFSSPSYEIISSSPPNIFTYFIMCHSQSKDFAGSIFFLSGCKCDGHHQAKEYCK